MADEVILDTNIATLLARRDAAILQRLAQVRLAYLPSVVLGELYFGAYRIAGTRKGQQLIQVYDAISAQLPVPTADLETAREYAHIRTELEALGQTIPPNELWIAAFACRYNLPIATRAAHVARLSGISVETW